MAKTKATTAERMGRLFQGLDRAYGAVTGHGGADDRGKVKARYVTRREPLTTEQWQQHLDGIHGLVPVPIRDDSTVSWAAIDIDEYDVDLPDLARKAAEAELPLITCRSKSGGAHLFLFLTEPAPAAEIRARLEDWAAALGYAGTEVFPKQIQLSSELDVGNGIAAPYRGGETSLEYALDDDGEAMSLAEFLDAAEARRRPLDLLPAAPERTDLDLEGAPPCLQRWAARGAGEGVRNDVAFDLGIYARKRWPDEWQSRFEALNQAVCRPPLPAKEIVTITRSIERRETYSYRAKCKGPLCRPAACRKAKYGRTPDDPGVDDLSVSVDGMTIVQTEPRTYIIRIDGRAIEVGSEALMRQDAFRRAALEQLDVLLPQLKRRAWARLIDGLVATADKVEAPEDAGPRGTLRHHLQDFLDERLAADAEKIRLGHAWFDEEHDRYYFRSKDFSAHLRRHRVTAKERDIYNMIRASGGDAERLRASGELLRVWFVPGDAPGDPNPAPEPEIPIKEDLE